MTLLTVVCGILLAACFCGFFWRIISSLLVLAVVFFAVAVLVAM